MKIRLLELKLSMRRVGAGDTTGSYLWPFLHLRKSREVRISTAGAYCLAMSYFSEGFYF